MRLSTLGHFLIGRRAAILEVAQSRTALLVGFLFVLSAGFAREYDGESLLHEPWHLALPLGGSLVTSFVLWTLVYVAALRGARNRPAFGAGYVAFLRCFWMTAPMAWLYAIPVERFLDPAVAAETNIWFLVLVASWRVILTIRVITVLFNTSGVSATILVLLFGDAVAVAAVNLAPIPVVGLMGGVRLDAASQVLANARCFVLFFGFLLFWPFALASLFVVLRRKEGWQWVPADAAPPDQGRSALVAAVVMLVFGAALLPFTQPEQYRRIAAEKLLRGGQVLEGLRYMGERGQAAFPPSWQPPPRPAYRVFEPELLVVVEALADHPDLAPWVRAEYFGRLQRREGMDWRWHGVETKQRLQRALRRCPEGPEVWEAFRQQGFDPDLHDDDWSKQR